jgi:hypothetical protein
MLSINTVLLLSLLVIAGSAAATPLVTERNSKQDQQQQIGFSQFSPDSENNDAQTQIEQASQQFDSFALQMPLVIKAKFEAFMKHGFRAVLMDDPGSKPAEEKMINSLTNGLHDIGGAFESDMASYEKSRKGNGEKSGDF